MSTKLLYSFTDDKKHMKNHNQIGCMSGLFQLFDRQHFLGGRRVNHKRLPPPGNDQRTQIENASQKGDNSRHDTKAGHGVSCESPRATVSSSTCSSAHTPRNLNKTATPQAASATPSMIYTEYSQSPMLNRGSDQLRGIVKESINREVPRIVVKTPGEKVIRNIVKHIDSPRPSLPSMPINPTISGLEESFKKLRKFQDIHNEGKERSLLINRREGHRFSCDGRVTNSQDTLKSTLKLKEQPRLSLDSRASSARKRLENYSRMSPKLEKPESCKHTSIVAKLMGLDITSEPTFTGNNSESNEPSNADNASEKNVASGYRTELSKKSIHLRNRGKVMMPISTSKLFVESAPWKDACSGLQKPGFGEATKNVPTLMPSVYGEIEKRVTELEFNKSSSDLRALKQILGAMQKSKDNIQRQNDFASDSLSQLSNKSICNSPLQVLKSADGLNLSGNLLQSVTSARDRHQERSTSSINVIKADHAVRNRQIRTSAECTTEGYPGLRKLRTSDVEGQRKDSIEKQMPSSRTPTAHRRDVSVSTLRVDNSSIASPRTARIKNSKIIQPLTAEKSNTARSSAIVSPRLQQRQQKFDKKVQQSSLPSESSRTKGHTNDADSPAKRIQLRASSSSMQKRCVKLAEVRTKSRSSIQLDNFSRSDSNISQSSGFVTEVPNMADLEEMEAAFFRSEDIKQCKTTSSDKRRAIADINIIAPEQPSPVSVLDSMFYQDESPSPVKKISIAFIADDDSFNQEEQRWTIKHGSSDSTTSLASNDYDKERVYNGEQLFEEQVNLYSTKFKNTEDCTLPVSDGKYQDDEYIFEILKASGLFQELESDLKTINHQPGHAISPGIFKFLEMKTDKQDSSVNMLNNNTVSKQSMNQDIVQKKLIFDIVKEISGRKLAQSNYNVSLMASRVADKSQAKQKLLKDICSEINQLQVTQSKCNYDDDYEECLKSIMLDDMQKHGPNGSEFHGEISSLVLDVERLIFKDLINEIISDAAEGPRITHKG